MNKKLFVLCFKDDEVLNKVAFEAKKLIKLLFEHSSIILNLLSIDLMFGIL